MYDMLYNTFASILWRRICNMKNYTEPKLEIVTLDSTDVITASGIMMLFRNSNIEDGGRASLSDFSTDGL